MKKLSLILISLLLFAFAGSTLAAKDAKTILHCGCVFDEFGVVGVGMVYHEIDVAGNSKGHIGHLVGTFDDCFDGTFTEDTPNTVPFIRSGEDCELSDSDDDIGQCTAFEDPDPVEGDDCGDLVID